MLMQLNLRKMSERVMRGLAQPLLIFSPDEGEVKDTAIKWVRGRQLKEAEDDDRWG